MCVETKMSPPSKGMLQPCLSKKIWWNSFDTSSSMLKAGLGLQLLKLSPNCVCIGSVGAGRSMDLVISESLKIIRMFWFSVFTHEDPPTKSEFNVDIIEAGKLPTLVKPAPGIGIYSPSSPHRVLSQKKPR